MNGGSNLGTWRDICTSKNPDTSSPSSGTPKPRVRYPVEPISNNDQGNDVQKIVKKLAHPHIAERLQAMEYLAKRGPEAKLALPALVLKLVDFDIRVRQVASRTLDTIDNSWTTDDSVVKQVIPQLVQALGKSPTREPEWACSVLTRIGRRAVPELDRALYEESDDVKQVWAARTLGRIGVDAEEAARDLGKALSSPKIHVREAAAKALVELGIAAEPALLDLIRALSDSHPPVRTATARALQRLGPTASIAVPGLVNLLCDRVDDVHKSAMDALAAMSTKAVPPLIRILENRTRRRAEAFTELLEDMIDIMGRVDPSAIGHYRVESYRNLLWHLQFALERSPEKVHEAAATILGMIGPEAKEAIPVLIEGSKDENCLLRREAVRALGLIGPAAGVALETLFEAGMDKDARVREYAVEALSNIDREWPTNPKIKAFIESLPRESMDSRQRNDVIEFLKCVAQAEENARAREAANKETDNAARDDSLPGVMGK